VTAPEVRALPMAQVRPDPEQPRREFSEEAIAELAGSIRESGLLQPITVHKVATRAPIWIIIAGERRYRAHIHNGAKTILARVLDDISEVDVLVAQIVENTQRADMTPLEEGRAYQRLVDQLGGDVELVAKKLGKMPWRITERTCLLRLAPEYQKLLAGKHLQTSQAFEMAHLSERGQKRLFEAIRFGQCPTYNTLRAVSLAIREKEAQTSIFDIMLAVPPGPTDEERWAASRLEKKISLACDVLAAGFDDNEVIAARKVDPMKAAGYADKLALMQKHLGQMERALRATVAVNVDLFAA
jgi:ParB family transcriptional regulator, chromosome partitioning protein